MSSATYLSEVHGMVRTAPGAVAALPNCDGCGRFASDPTVVDHSWSGGAGMYMCGELLLCPRCATNRAKKDEERPHD